MSWLSGIYVTPIPTSLIPIYKPNCTQLPRKCWDDPSCETLCGQPPVTCQPGGCNPLPRDSCGPGIDATTCGKGVCINGGCSADCTGCSENPPPPSCIPDGSCNAPAPSCGQVTFGTNNCGDSCTRAGPICPPECTARFSWPESVSGWGTDLIWSSARDADGVLPYTCTGDLGSGSVSPDSGSRTMFPTQSQTCTLTVSNPSGTATCQASVTVYPPLTGSCSVSPTGGIPGDPFIWTAEASGSNGIYEFIWNGRPDPNPLDGKRGKEVKVNYDRPGTFFGEVSIRSLNANPTFACGSVNIVSPPEEAPPRFKEIPPP